MSKQVPIIEASDLSPKDKLKLVQEIMADLDMPNSIEDIANLTDEQSDFIMDKILNAN